MKKHSSTERFGRGCKLSYEHWFIFRLSLCCLTTLTAAAIALWLTSDPLSALQRSVLSQVSYSAAVETSEDNDFYWSANRIHRILVQQLGATVSFADPAISGAAGSTSADRTVIIDSHLHWTARFETLAHEAGHLLQPDALATRMDGEVFAESVAYLVAIHDGDKEALRRSSRYLSGMKASLHIMTEYRLEILRAAAFLE